MEKSKHTALVGIEQSEIDESNSPSQQTCASQTDKYSAQDFDGMVYGLMIVNGCTLF